MEVERSVARRMEALRPGTGSRSEEGVTSNLRLETEAAHLTAMAVARLVAVQAHQNRARQEGTPLQPEREDAVGVGPIMEEVRVGGVAGLVAVAGTLQLAAVVPRISPSFSCPSARQRSAVFRRELRFMLLALGKAIMHNMEAPDLWRLYLVRTLQQYRPRAHRRPRAHHQPQLLRHFPSQFPHHIALR